MRRLLLFCKGAVLARGWPFFEAVAARTLRGRPAIPSQDTSEALAKHGLDRMRQRD